MSLGKYKKDPDSKLDYSFDWSNYLESGSSISTSTFHIKPSTDPALEIVENSEAQTSTGTSLKLENGKVGEEYTVTNRIQTDDGLTVDRSIEILIVER